MTEDEAKKRTSWVFHDEWLDDLPDYLMDEFALYAIKYHRTGEEPDFKAKYAGESKMIIDLLESYWKKVKTQMDYDTKKYASKCEKLRQNAAKKKKTTKKVETTDKKEPEPTEPKEKQKEAVHTVQEEDSGGTVCRTCGETLILIKGKGMYCRQCHKGDWEVTDGK